MPRPTIFCTLLLPLAIMLIAISGGAVADDWPTFRHDNHRSGKTAERISPTTLQPAWVWQSPTPPQPAWAGPAKWDAYAQLRGLRSMRNYDPVFHVVAAAGSLYFGSSADDSVHCLDAATGKQKWIYTTDGPVRIAPTYAGGKLYFGSDDGHAYCLDADSGHLVWKHCPAPNARRVLNNGRLIPLWPCRTGVLVEGKAENGGTAFFAAGMLPWKESYLCAVDAQTGKAEGPGRYVSRHQGVTLEGAMLASADRLFVPQGRVAPLSFERMSGKSLGSVGGKGGGGCFVLLTDDAHLLHGPGNKAGWITDSNAQTREKVASFDGGNEMVVDGQTAYLLTDNRLAAIDRRTKKTVWSKSGEYPYAIILAGDVLFAGGRDVVAAFAAEDGTLLWEGKVPGRAYGLAVSDGQLLVSTGEGTIYCFRPESSVAPPDRLTESPPADVEPLEPIQSVAEQPESSTPALRPYLQFTGPDSAVARWETAVPSATILEYGDGETTRRVEDTAPKTRHEATLTNLRHNMLYHYVVKVTVGGKELSTAPFECDTFFNYSPAAIVDTPDSGANRAANRAADGRAARQAKKILSETPDHPGICLVLGSGDGRLAYELARRSRLRVIGVETSADAVAASRQALLRAGVYGSRVAIHQVDSLTTLPFIDGFASLLVSDRVDRQADLLRYVRPDGMLAIMQDAWKWERRPPPDDAGVWSHQYGLPDNSGYGGESLQGAVGVDDLRVQWLGRPGPRAQADRNGRKPSPLSTGGRLFMQGLHRMIALDAYNGSLLWSLEIPSFERFNVPRDCSNWCADEKYVFAAMKDKCWQIDAADGRVTRFHDVEAGPRGDRKYDWGYVASHGDLLIGSAVKQGTSWTNFFGGSGAGWYDARSGEVTHKICSDNLFALEKKSGKVRYTYEGPAVINPTITIGGDRVYFVECRNAKVIESDSSRVGMPELWQDQYLVALHAETGRKIWQVPLDTADGTVVFYLAYGDEKLVLVSSDVKYHTYAFDAASGSRIWDVHFDWPSDNHGKHMSRPAIGGGKVFVRPKVIDLVGGKIQDTPMPGGGCGTYALTDRTVVYRAGNVTLWDIEDNKASSWSRLRPGCWLSTIPAVGMLLSPEAGGGCSCGKWMETSIGFAPR